MVQDLEYGKLENEFRNIQPRSGDLVICIRGNQVLVVDAELLHSSGSRPYGRYEDLWFRLDVPVFAMGLQDVVISASAVDIVRPCCEKLGIKYIMGSPVDMRTGAYSGPNCHGEEKIMRFRAAFPGAEIEEFYSDSHSDDPMARIAKKSFMVKGETLTEWSFDK